MTDLPEKSDWARPAGCDCFTLAMRDRCYENCDPVEPKKKTPFRYKMILLFFVILPLLALTVLVALAVTSAVKASDFNYECFGAGRYDAMSRGFDETDCPKPGQEFDEIDGHYRYPLGHVAWRLPNYCDAFKLLERSCASVRLMEKMYGRAGAENRARKCGATDADIAEANACPKK